jgi:hypothetical protein
MNLHVRSDVGLLLHDRHFGGRSLRPFHLEDIDGPLPGIKPTVHWQVKANASVLKEQLEHPIRPWGIGAAAGDFLGIFDWIGEAEAAGDAPRDQPREHRPEIACGPGPSLVSVNRGLCIDRGECGYDFATQRDANILKIDVVTFLAPIAQHELIGVTVLVFCDQRSKGLALAGGKFSSDLLGCVNLGPEILVLGIADVMGAAL